jgi:hypothetical protein
MLVVLTMFFSASFAQTAKITVTGKVTDTTGITLPGVSITVVNNSKVGTLTDVNGRFILDVEDGATARVFLRRLYITNICGICNKQYSQHTS